MPFWDEGECFYVRGELFFVGRGVVGDDHALGGDARGQGFEIVEMFVLGGVEEDEV